MDFTFLKEDQIWGDDALEVMKHYGTEVTPTDLSYLLGGIIADNPTFGGGITITCEPWTASLSGNGYVCCVDFDGRNGRSEFADSRNVSARPVLSPFEASKISPSNAKVINGIRVAEYGEYPQMVAEEPTRKRLERLYGLRTLRPTGKKYTFDLNALENDDISFEADAYPEYELDGKRYIRVLAPYEESCLSTGESVEAGEPCWVEVQPIEWLMDPSGTMVAKKCLFAGIQFDTKSSYDGDFSKTFIKHYLDTYFAKEMDPIERMAERTVSREPVKKKEPTARQKRHGISVNYAPMSLQEQIESAVQDGESFMLHGPAGVGKSQRVRQIDPDLTAITLRNGILPEQFDGKTVYPIGTTGETKAFWEPPLWYKDLCRKCETEPEKKHILFIDEVTNVRETVQTYLYPLVEERSLSHGGVGKLPDNAVVVLAGNSVEESSGAYNMPEPLFTRLAHFYLDYDLKDWLEWGSEPSTSHPEDPERLNIHPLVASFVATYGQQVFHLKYNEENPGKFALNPRVWEKVSNKIYARKGVIRMEELSPYIGEDIAKSFFAYAENPPLSLEEVIEGEYTREDIPQGQDARLALALSLRQATPKQVGKVRQFVESQLGPENRAIFDSVWIGKDDARAVQIAGLSNLHNLNIERGNLNIERGR